MVPKLPAFTIAVPETQSGSISATGSNFFQAEDGIRDYKVTGVQTCALPIYCVLAWNGEDCIHALEPLLQLRATITAGHVARSEERRVGKEGRSRGSPHP